MCDTSVLSCASIALHSPQIKSSYRRPTRIWRASLSTPLARASRYASIETTCLALLCLLAIPELSSLRWIEEIAPQEPSLQSHPRVSDLVFLELHDSKSPHATYVCTHSNSALDYFAGVSHQLQFRNDVLLLHLDVSSQNVLSLSAPPTVVGLLNIRNTQCGGGNSRRFEVRRSTWERGYRDSAILS